MSCRPASLSWADVGARSRNDFVNTCQAEWDRTRILLTSAEASAALDVCEDTSDFVDAMSCEEVIALYADQ